MTFYAIIVAQRAKKQVERLPIRLKDRIGVILEEVLAAGPFVGKSLKGALKGLYSYRIGDYRIIYDVIKDRLAIRVVKVMHRREVYRGP
jgi:mRNA interferase RelE/StbE